jgi:hypothetical protein
MLFAGSPNQGTKPKNREYEMRNTTKVEICSGDETGIVRNSLKLRV